MTSWELKGKAGKCCPWTVKNALYRQDSFEQLVSKHHFFLIRTSVVKDREVSHGLQITKLTHVRKIFEVAQS